MKPLTGKTLILTFTDAKQELYTQVTFSATAKAFAMEVAKALELSTAIKNIKLVTSMEEVIYPPKEQQ